MKINYKINNTKPKYGEIVHISLNIQTHVVSIYQDTPAKATDAVPIAEWLGIERVYPVVGYEAINGATHVNFSKLVDFVCEGEGKDLIQRILIGSEVVWDGSNNHVYMDADALNAERELENALAEFPDSLDLIDFTCDDWFRPSLELLCTQPNLAAVHEWLDWLTSATILLDGDPRVWYEEASKDYLKEIERESEKQ